MSSRCRKGVGLGCFVVCAFRIISDTKIFGKISSSSSEKYFHYLIYPPSNIHLNITSGFTCWNCVKELSSSIVRSWVGSGRWWFHPQLQDVSGCFIHNFRWKNPMENQHFQDEHLWFSSFFIHRFFRSEHGKLTKHRMFSAFDGLAGSLSKAADLCHGFLHGPLGPPLFVDFKRGEMLTNNSQFGCFFKEYTLW